jgi:hypothetical protein
VPKQLHVLGAPSKKHNAAAITQPPAAEMILLPAGGWHRTIFINKNALDYIVIHLPTGVEVQNALKDCLKETLPSLKFEVRTPVGQIDCLTDDRSTRSGNSAFMGFMSQGAKAFCTSKARRMLPERSRKSLKPVLNMESTFNYKRCTNPVSRRRFGRSADCPQFLVQEYHYGYGSNNPCRSPCLLQPLGIG